MIVSYSRNVLRSPQLMSRTMPFSTKNHHFTLLGLWKKSYSSCSRRKSACLSEFEKWLAENPLPTIALKNTEEDEFHTSEIMENRLGTVDSSSNDDSCDENWIFRGNDEASGKMNFSWKQSFEIISTALHSESYRWSKEKKCFFPVKGYNLKSISPPLIHFPPPEINSKTEYLSWLSAITPQESSESCQIKDCHLITLLSSNSAVLAVIENGNLMKHKVITAYTVRAKQGKSQLSHLRAGGGNGRMSVGGGIRAQETKRLYQRINEKLEEWEDDIKGCRLLLSSGTVRTWNEVFSNKNPPCVVTREDHRWTKVPISVRKPRLKDVQKVWYSISYGRFQ